MNQVSFLVDGFNLYHSLVEAGAAKGKCLKWLDIASLLNSYSHLMGANKMDARISYFSALATHREEGDSSVIQRHRTYLRALESTGVVSQLGRFKARKQFCKNCKIPFVRFEEKETDVAMAVSFMEEVANPAVGTVVLVSGDSDLSPALRMARKRFPKKRIGVAFPFQRHTQELRSQADFSWKLRADRYLAHHWD